MMMIDDDVSDHDFFSIESVLVWVLVPTSRTCELGGILGDIEALRNLSNQ
jgi:hypothetical protein